MEPRLTNDTIKKLLSSLPENMQSLRADLARYLLNPQAKRILPELLRAYSEPEQERL